MYVDIYRANTTVCVHTVAISVDYVQFCKFCSIAIEITLKFRIFCLVQENIEGTFVIAGNQRCFCFPNPSIDLEPQCKHLRYCTICVKILLGQNEKSKSLMVL